MTVKPYHSAKKIDRVRARKKKGAPCEAPLPVSTDRF